MVHHLMRASRYIEGIDSVAYVGGDLNIPALKTAEEDAENQALGFQCAMRQRSGGFYEAISWCATYNGVPFNGALYILVHYIMVHHLMAHYLMVHHLMVRYV